VKRLQSKSQSAMTNYTVWANDTALLFSSVKSELLHPTTLYSFSILLLCSACCMGGYCALWFGMTTSGYHFQMLAPHTECSSPCTRENFPDCCLQSMFMGWQSSTPRRQPIASRDRGDRQCSPPRDIRARSDMQLVSTSFSAERK
jgi:hypothetical protein